MTDTFDPFAVYDRKTLVASDPVEIEAPASVVWQVLVDMPRYNEWNPYCVRAESTLEMGAPVNMTLVDYVNPGHVGPWCEYICAVEPEHLLSWQYHPTPDFPYEARRDQVITPLGPERCRYISTDAFTGENAQHVMTFVQVWVKRAFDDTARALKQRAEAIYAAQASNSKTPQPAGPVS